MAGVAGVFVVAVAAAVCTRLVLVVVVVVVVAVSWLCLPFYLWPGSHRCLCLGLKYTCELL